MKVCPWHEIQSLAVKQMGKPAVYVGNGLEYATMDRLSTALQDASILKKAFRINNLG